MLLTEPPQSEMYQINIYPTDINYIFSWNTGLFTKLESYGDTRSGKNIEKM